MVLKVVSQQSGVAFFGRALRCAPFLLEGCGMDVNFFKDILFDLMNESDALDVDDIQSDDRANKFLVLTKDGTAFSVHVTKIEN